ncbi:MAG TPA: S8 family serine peptidase, partial [Vicinamibacterales bacterium]|nr:S8 family serine peptidase [Vicinamibacterales bacterium]
MNRRNEVRKTETGGNVVWRRGLPLALLASLLMGSVPLRAQSLPGTAVAHKFDAALKSRMASSVNGATYEAVIVRLKPGARHGLIRRLKAAGLTVYADLGLVEGVAVKLPRHLLEQLARDKDVLSVSLDAQVQSVGLVSSPAGEAEHGGYSLRRTLGLETASETAATQSFRQGANGYTSVVDGGADSHSPLSSFGSASTIYVEGFGRFPAGMLLRFDNLVGTGAGQIPPGSTITSVSLRVMQRQNSNSSAQFTLHRMVSPWVVDASWLSLTTSGPGLQFDNVEASSSPDASMPVAGAAGGRTFTSGALAATVQGWVNGETNNGWALWLNQSSSIQVATSEDGSPSSRPMLTVTYRAPVQTTSLTGAGVTVALIDSGVLLDSPDASRLKTTRDFTTGLPNPPAVAPLDPYGHGTHVAGLVGSDQAVTAGVAPNVSFVSLRVLDPLGSGMTSHVINAIQWAVAHRAAYGIDVLNLSLGHPPYESAATDPLVQAVEAAVRAGIVVVSSAGNIGKNPETGLVGYAGISSPGNAPSALTVGAFKTFETATRTD